MNRRIGMHLRMGHMYLSFLLVLVVCALALHAANLVQSYFSMFDQVRKEREHILQQQLYHTERYMQELEDCANTLCISTRLQQVLIGRQTPDYLAFADCRDLLTEHEMAPHDIYRIDLYLCDSNSLITSSEGVFYDLQEGRNEIYKSLLARCGDDGASYWTLEYQNREPGIVSRMRNVQRITLAKRVVSIYTGRTKGVLLLSVPYGNFESYIAQTPENEYSTIHYGQTLLCGEPFGKEGWEKITVESRVPGLRLTYEYQFEFTSIFSGGFIMVMTVIMLLFLLSFVLIVIITERRVAKPIGKVLSAFHRVERGEFDVRLEDGDDKIFGDLNRGFDHMAGHLQSTVTELVDERTRGRELKQRLLMMQIKPHFLYNIFNNMIWLVEQKKYENLEQLVTATAGFYKSALNAGSEDIMLCDNQRQLDYYVRIQKFRFGDRFDLEMTVSEEAEMLSIPNLLLQPLVENCISHGFQGIDRHGVISFHACVREDMLLLSVLDNGRGIEAERLEQIRRAMMQDSAETREFFALVNVSARLRNRYGNEASIEIRSEKDAGTEVNIRIPAHLC